MRRIASLGFALVVVGCTSAAAPSIGDSGVADTRVAVDSADSGGALEVDALTEPADTLPPCVDADYHVTLEGDSGLRLTQGCAGDPAPSWKLAACCGEDPRAVPAAVACGADASIGLLPLHLRLDGPTTLDRFGHVTITSDDRVLGGVVEGTWASDEAPELRASFRVCRRTLHDLDGGS